MLPLTVSALKPDNLLTAEGVIKSLTLFAILIVLIYKWKKDGWFDSLEISILPYVEKVTDIEKLQLKNLYRKLVKKYHPDYAKNLTEREQREEMMKQVNQAYTEGDEKKLRRLYFDK